MWKKFNIDYNSYGDDLPESEYSIWMVDILNEMKTAGINSYSILDEFTPEESKLLAVK